MSDTRLDGLIQAHRFVADAARKLPKPRWWQMGWARYWKMVMLNEVSDQLYEEITRLQEARMDEILANCAKARTASQLSGASS